MDKAYKRKRRLRSIVSIIYMIFISILILPLAFITQKLWKSLDIKSSDFFGMGISFDDNFSRTLALVEELDLKKLLIRFRMDKIENIEKFKIWLKNFNKYDIVLNIIQDPNIKEEKLTQAFDTIFNNFFPFIKKYQIGTTINRSKWGFYSVSEYLNFFHYAQKLRKRYKGIKLFGPSVIDFEYHYTTQALFNPYNIYYDGCSALLYVDRCITPENKQFGFNLLGKINLLYSLISLSPKSKNKILITETNWPIKNSGKYSPTSNLECVNEEDFANYLIRYYLLAIGSSKVEVVYWHKLIAVGFGLVNPNKNFEKRDAFFSFKMMLKQLQEAKDIKLSIYNSYYELAYENSKYLGKVLWTNGETIDYRNGVVFRYFTKEGKECQSKYLKLTSSPIYLITKELI